MYSRRTSRYQRRSSTTRLTPPRVLPPELLRRIEVDPIFQIMTSDRQTWIDPYSGKGVPASLGRLPAAREYLLENEGIWRNGQSTLPQSQLEYERWRQDLIKLLPAEPRLRIFGREGFWLNPYSGEFVAGITRDDGKITFRTVSAIARHLCLNAAARSGRLFESSTIAEILRKEIARGGAPVLDEAMRKASTVQRQMLPELPRLERFAVAVHYRAHHGVSGDFYDILTLPDGRLLFVIGDVSGHGLQAALVVATALKTLRFVARSEGSLIELLSRFNDEIKTDLIPGQFITLVALALDQPSGEISCVRAGHHPGLLATLTGETVLRRVGKSGMAIGLATGTTFSHTLREEQLVMQPGDVLVHFTDGLIEAIGPGDVAYGEARLYGSVLAHLDQGPQELADAMAEDVSRWAQGPVGDDVTVLTLSALLDSQTTGPMPGPMSVTGVPLAVERLPEGDASDDGSHETQSDAAGDALPQETVRGGRQVRDEQAERQEEETAIPPRAALAAAADVGGHEDPLASHEPSETGELEAPAPT